MPAIVRKLLIFAAVDGLLLSPHRSQKPISPVLINYATKEITNATASDVKGLASIEAHGIAGLFTVASSSFLIAISSRQQVAQIRGKPVYVITGVTLIPVSSQQDAARAIEQSKKDLKEAEQRGDASDNDSTDEDDTAAFSAGEEVDDNEPIVKTDDKRPPSSKAGGHTREPSVAQNVIQRRGQYGRFAERWFSKKGWTADKRRAQGLSKEEDQPDAPSVPDDPSAPTKEDVKTASTEDVDHRSQANEATIALLPKLLRTTKLLFGSRNFYFSYDYDLTRRWGTSESNSRDLPLSKVVDPLFFWNRALSSTFSNAGYHSFVLPLLQGFVGQKAFTIDTSDKGKNSVVLDAKEEAHEVIELQDRAVDGATETKPDTKDYLITLISRRSVERPGLRYLRRGVDENGHVANAVETEQILSEPSWATSTAVYSFTQIRGSIPLFFSQSPYSLKPVPVLQHSAATNHDAFKRHFAFLGERYGKVQIAMLVDKHGTEAKIGEAFEEHAQQYIQENSKVGFEWFDFHKVCAGMKFENVNILMETLKPSLSSFGITKEVDGRIEQVQSGVLRTNCMDCLDRTNVVQSATAQRALESQLASSGSTLDLQADPSTSWFNALWADNGDAISKQYSSTAALKGDFTRTRKRNYRGALNDFGLTLSRYYNNIVNDYFSQVTIDFLLGNVTDNVFEEFESSMMTSDPGVSMKRVRQNAIDTSAKIVIADESEDLAGGWTLATPQASNTLRSFPFEEIVLLLTDAAIYAVRFDWNTEKVSSFERIDLNSITSAKQGVYITNTLSSSQTDPARNVGFVLSYRPDKDNLERVNTRSMSTKRVPTLADFDGDGGSAEPGEGTLAPQQQQQQQQQEDAGNKDQTDGPSAFDGSTSSKSKPNKDDNRDDAASGDTRILALKALPAKSSVASGNRDLGEILTEKQVIGDVCRHVVAALGRREDWVRDEDIIGLAEAKRSTGLLEQWGHSLKKLVWA